MSFFTTIPDVAAPAGATARAAPRIGILTGDVDLAGRLHAALGTDRTAAWWAGQVADVFSHERLIDIDLVIVGPGVLPVYDEGGCDPDVVAVTQVLSSVAVPVMTFGMNLDTTTHEALVARGLAADIADVDTLARRITEVLSHEAHIGGWRSVAADRAERVTDMERAVAQVLHDVRSPLSSVAAAIQLATDERVPAEERRLLSVNLADTVMNIIDDADEFLQVAGSGEEERDLLDVVALLTEIGEINELTVTHRGVSHIHVPVRIVRHVLMNLASNARRHGGADISRLDVVVTSTDDGLSITIDDDGIGISGDPERLFAGRTPTGRLHRGLPWTRMMARRHGGDVTAGCAPDGGARFVVWLAPTLPPIPSSHR